jgi:hypothetical protein
LLTQCEGLLEHTRDSLAAEQNGVEICKGVLYNEKKAASRIQKELEDAPSQEEVGNLRHEKKSI